MIGKYFTECCDAHSPGSRFSQFIFKLLPYTEFSNIAFPVITACRSLVSETSDEITLFRVFRDILEPGNVNSIGSSSEKIFIIISFRYTTCTATEVMVHHIMAKLTAA